MPKLEKRVQIKSRMGLHARPAAMFVQIANKFDSKITVRKGEDEVNGKSIMGILMLGADHGCDVLLTADGPDCAKAIEELEAFLGKED